MQVFKNKKAPSGFPKGAFFFNRFYFTIIFFVNDLPSMFTLTK